MVRLAICKLFPLQKLYNILIDSARAQIAEIDIGSRNLMKIAKGENLSNSAQATTAYCR
jgi:hypothetical protein